MSNSASKKSFAQKKKRYVIFFSSPLSEIGIQGGVNRPKKFIKKM
jgi:hypothetical protein